jgi:hypothetical protein
MTHPAEKDAVREALRERLCGFEDDGQRVVRVTLLGSLDEIAEAVMRVIPPAETYCGAEMGEAREGECECLQCTPPEGGDQ